MYISFKIIPRLQRYHSAEVQIRGDAVVDDLKLKSVDKSAVKGIYP